jgi:quinol-cytochrome oxidoreductase complex cytochrome b subunit
MHYSPMIGIDFRSEKQIVLNVHDGLWFRYTRTQNGASMIFHCIPQLCRKR